MVKVWYQPPPYGPRTDLNRPAYGIGKDVGPRWVVAISKMPATPVILGFISVFACIAYIPVSKSTRSVCIYFCYWLRFLTLRFALASNAQRTMIGTFHNFSFSIRCDPLSFTHHIKFALSIFCYAACCLLLTFNFVCSWEQWGRSFHLLFHRSISRPSVRTCATITWTQSLVPPPKNHVTPVANNIAETKKRTKKK